MIKNYPCAELAALLYRKIIDLEVVIMWWQMHGQTKQIYQEYFIKIILVFWASMYQNVPTLLQFLPLEYT